MRFAHGSQQTLKRAHHDPQSVVLVVERFEEATPHLIFEHWRAFKQKNSGTGSAVTWVSPDRTEIKVVINLPNNIRIWTKCNNGLGAIQIDDYNFLLALAEEVARILGANLNTFLSLFDFGTVAVANEIHRRGNLESNPLSVIRFIRSLAQESYENQRLSYGVIFTAKFSGADSFADAFDNKRTKRLTDGFSTALLIDPHLRISGYAPLATPLEEGTRLPRRPWWCAGLAAMSESLEGVGVALVRSGDMLIVHKGRLLFSLRAGKWRLWNHAAILGQLEEAWGNDGNPGQVWKVLRYLYHVALDLSFRKSGGLLVVLARKDDIEGVLTSRSDRLGADRRGAAEKAIDNLLRQHRIHNTDRRIVADLASLDGALIVDRSGRTLAYGAMTVSGGGAKQGARTRAAFGASRFGLAIKISSDGNITVFSGGTQVMDL